MSSRKVISAVALAVVVAASASALAHATSPGHNGRIAYMRQDAAGHWQVWVAGSRLTGARKLTAGPADSTTPVWSPDGTKLTFDSSRTDPDPNDPSAVNDVFTMTPDGSKVTKLTDSVGISANAAWSPDGSLIAIEADRGDPDTSQGIYVMNADGTGLRRVTVRPRGYQEDSAPRFSPDGSRLVFTRYRGSGASEKAALYTVRLDGTGLSRITTFAIHAGDADWSPDGRRIVFEAYPSSSSYVDIYVIGADGRNLRNLTHNVGHAGSADPVWSPDGTRILFLANRNVGGRGRKGLATMKPDGSERHFVSAPNSPELHQPDWESVH
jgi:Tol biopolymer transport system component